MIRTNKKIIVIKFIIWLVAAFIIWTFAARLLSQPSDILVGIGVLILGLFIILTWISKFFTRVSWNELKNFFGSKNSQNNL